MNRHVPERVSRAIRWSVFAMIALALTTFKSFAQTQNGFDIGTPAESKGGVSGHSTYAYDKIETINLANGNLNLHIPLVTVGGRGSASYTVALNYNSKLWTGQKDTEVISDVIGQPPETIDHYTATYDDLTARIPNTIFLGSGWSILKAPVIKRRPSLLIPLARGTCAGMPEATRYKYVMTKVWFVTPDGTELEMLDDVTDGVPFLIPNPCSSQTDTSNRGRTWRSTDGSAITYITDAANGVVAGSLAGSVFLADGTKLVISSNGRCEKMIDRNGNVLDITYDDSASGAVTYTDSLGRKVEVARSANGATVKITGYGAVADRTFNIVTGQVAPNENNLPAPNLRSDFQNTLQYPRPFTSGDLSRLPGNEVNQHAIYGDNPHTDLIFRQDPDPTVVNNSDVYGGETVISSSLVTVVTRLDLLDGRSFKFRYNPWGEVAEIEYPAGGITQFDYAPHGTSMCEAAALNQMLNRRVKERRVFNDGGNLDARWTYTRASTTPNPSVAVEVRQGASNELLMSERHYFLALDAQHGSCRQGTHTPKFENAREFKVERQIGGGGIHTETRDWANRAPLNWPDNHPYVQAHGRDNPQNDPRVNREETRLENDKRKRTDYVYDRFNNATLVTEFDYGAIPGAIGPKLRETARTYATDLLINGHCYTNLNATTGNCASIENTNHDHIIHMRRLVLSEEVKNGAGGREAFTEYEYDNYVNDGNHAPVVINALMTKYNGNRFNPFNVSFQPRGNVTKVTRWISGTGAAAQNAISYSRYDNAGNVVSVKDPRGNVTVASYADNFGDGSNPDSGSAGLFGPTFALLTSLTNPAPFNHTIKAQYDFTRGVATGVKDANGVITKTDYDLFDRPITITAALGLAEQSVTQMTHPTPFANEARTSKQLDAVRWMSSKVIFDGFGRPVISSQSEDGLFHSSANFSIHAKTIYDGLGRAVKVTNPYRAAASSTDGWTRTSYDLAGRVKEVASFGGDVSTPPPDAGISGVGYSGSVIASYDENKSTTRDQAGKQRRSTSDGLGRLVTVEEMQQHPSTSVYSTTNYSYDGQGNLTQVSQGASPTQVRRFAYDGLSRLVRAANPEQVASSHATFSLNGQPWAVRYDYDLASNLTAKTDTRPVGAGFVTVSYSYDNLNRISARTYNDGTPGVSYGYDTAPRGVGRLRSVVTAGVSAYNYTSYDAIGRLTQYNQQTDSQTYLMSATFNKAGLMTSETYPSLRVVATDYDGAGRIAGVKNQSTGQYYAGATAGDATNRLQYTAHGAVSRMKLGNGLWEHTNFNPRLQPTRTGLGISGTSTSLLGLDYNYGTTNNGDLQTQTINAPGLSITQAYTYDQLNRLLSAQESVGGVRWTQTFGYDQFGNRTSLINTGVDAPSLPPPQAHPVNASTNRFTNFTYDAAGNVRADHTGNTFSYDAESRQITSGVAGTQAAYSYDGDGRRVKKVVGNVATVFVYNASGQLVAEYGGLTSGESGTNYLTSDHLGSTRAVTTESGAVRARHDYLPFGEEIPANVGSRQNVPGYTSSDSTRQRFTSKERDIESGLDYFLARYYSSAQGRFTSVDPAISSGKPDTPQSWNRYAYCINNPLVFIDPLGLDWRENDKTGEIRWYKNGEDTNGTTALTKYEYKINDTQEVHLNPWGPGSGPPDVYPYLSIHETNSNYYKWGWDIRDIITDRGGPRASGAVETDWNAQFAIGGLLNASRVGLTSLLDDLFASFGRSTATTVTNPVPTTLARVIPGQGPFTTLGKEGAQDVFVTAADDIAGLSAKQLSQRLTMAESKSFTVLEFPTPRFGIASPINRTNPGFVGFGRTAGGAREFVIPNGPIPANAVTKVVN